MPYTIKESRSYSQARAAVHAAAVESITTGLEGSILDQNQDRIEGKFPKTIHGKVLGDRTQIELDLSETASGGTDVAGRNHVVCPSSQYLRFDNALWSWTVCAQENHNDRRLLKFSG
jgi:hypothetical protein